MSVVERDSPGGRSRKTMTASSSGTDASKAKPAKTTGRNEQLRSRPPVKRNTCIVKLDGCRYTISEYIVCDLISCNGDAAKRSGILDMVASNTKYVLLRFTFAASFNSAITRPIGSRGSHDLFS